MNNIKKIHFIGIKGVGMAALAIFAKEKGYEVTGSDVKEEFVTDKALLQAKIPVFEFDPQNLKDKPDLVVVSAAYDKDNPEIKEAKKRRLEIKPYSETLAFFASGLEVIAVAGIHGKTTTSALISFLLFKANLDPSFVIGSGEVLSLPATGHFGKGDYFVLEADEYRKSAEDLNSKFFDLSPEIEVITSIEMDHPDMFPTEQKVYDAFYKFACRLPRSGFIVLCTDYPWAKRLLRSLVDRKFETYGFDEGALWRIVDFSDTGQRTTFNLNLKGKILGPFELQIPGRGNALNATAAIITALKIGIEEKLIKKYLQEFVGVKRRFEKIYQNNDIVIIDDYAHHPRSVKMALETIKNKYPDKKLWCIFQPHTYSRTKELLSDFEVAFKAADEVIIADIYSSEREKEVTISAEDLASAIRKNQKQVKYVGGAEKIIEMAENISEPAVIITMGAGDIYKVGLKISEKFKNEK